MRPAWLVEPQITGSSSLVPLPSICIALKSAKTRSPEQVIHSILDIMYAKAQYTVIQRAVNIHPTVCELIPTMLGELRRLAGVSGIGEVVHSDQAKVGRANEIPPHTAELNR